MPACSGDCGSTTLRVATGERARCFWRVVRTDPAMVGCVAIVGDSITNQNWCATGLWSRQHTGSGYANHALAILGQRVALAYNAADVSYEFATYGYTSAQIRTVHVPQVIAAAPDHVVVHAGSNDIGGAGLSSSQAMSGLAAVWDALRAADIKVIATTVLPRSQALGSVFRDRKNALNAMILAEAAARGIPVVDWATPFTGPDGYVIDGVTGDGVHPNNAGAAMMGRKLAELFGDVRLFRLGEEPIHAALAGAINPNPSFAGGTAMASGWDLLSGGGSAVATKTPDGFQQIVCAHANRLTSWTEVHQTCANGWVAGDTLEAWAEVETDEAGYDGSLVRVTMVARPSNLFCGWGNNGSTSQIIAPADRKAVAVYRTPPGIVPEGTSRLDLYVTLHGSGSYRIKKAFVRKVP